MIWRDLLSADSRADKVVPPAGSTARLTVITSAVLSFLAVFALSLSFSANELAARWEAELRGTATIRISAPESELDIQTAIVVRVLEQTPGTAEIRALSDADQRELLEPWFGADLPVEELPLPRLVEFREVEPGYDSEGLRQRLRAEAPGALLDDHDRWRQPLVVAAERLRFLGFSSVLLIGGVVAALISLAASTSLAVNAQVIEVLRVVAAKDSFIIRAFVRRYTIRALLGAAIGTVLAVVILILRPGRLEAVSLFDGLGFRGAEWLVAAAVPPVAALVAFLATWYTAARVLRDVR